MLRILGKIGWRLHGVVVLIAMGAALLARVCRLIPIGDDRYEVIRPADMHIPVVGFSASTYLCLGVCLPVAIFGGIGAVVFSPLALAPPLIFLFTGIICRLVLDAELREAIRTKREKKRQDYLKFFK